MTEPLVTVAVPNLNHGRYLGEALESIFTQGVPVEVVVMDGGSEDHSCPSSSQWKRQASWDGDHGPDGGQAEAVNQGIAMGSAPYVCWLNSDDVFLPGGLRLLLGALSECHEPPVAYGRCWTLNERWETAPPLCDGAISSVAPEELLFHCPAGRIDSEDQRGRP